MNDYEYLEETPRYRKKSTAKPPKKSKHKHLVKPCVLEYPADWFNKPARVTKKTSNIAGYCPICGKLGNLKDKSLWYGKETIFVGNYQMTETVATEEGKKQLNPATRTLPTFYVDDPFAKFVEISNDEKGE